MIGDHFGWLFQSRSMADLRLKLVQRLSTCILCMEKHHLCPSSFDWRLEYDWFWWSLRLKLGMWTDDGFDCFWFNWHSILAQTELSLLPKALIRRQHAQNVGVDKICTFTFWAFLAPTLLQKRNCSMVFATFLQFFFRFALRAYLARSCFSFERFAGQLMVWGDCVMKLGQDLNFGPSRRSDKSWGKVGIFKRNALKMWGWVNSDHFPHEKFILVAESHIGDKISHRSVREFRWDVSRLAEKEAGATRGDGWSWLNLKVIWPVWGWIARLGSSSIFFSALLVPCYCLAWSFRNMFLFGSSKHFAKPIWSIPSICTLVLNPRAAYGHGHCGFCFHLISGARFCRAKIDGKTIGTDERHRRFEYGSDFADTLLLYFENPSKKKWNGPEGSIASSEGEGSGVPDCEDANLLQTRSDQVHEAVSAPFQWM